MNNDINNSNNNVVNNNMVNPNNIANTVYQNPATINNNPGMVDPNSINSVVNGANTTVVNSNVMNTYTSPTDTGDKVSGNFIERFRTKLNNFGKTRTFKIILFVLVILIVLFLLLKLLLVITFNKINTYPKFITNYANRSSFSISTNEYELGESDALYFNEVKFINLLDNSFLNEEIKSNNGNKGILYKSETWKSSLEIKSENTFINAFVNDSKSYAKGINTLLSGTSNSRKKYLEKNKINSDIDLFNFIYKKKDTEISFTSSISEIIKVGSLKLFASSYLPDADEIMVLAGNYDGYILVTNEGNSINVEYSDKRYVITVNGNFFYDDMLQEIVNTLEIE